MAMRQAKVMTTQLFVDKITLVSPLTAALFGAYAGAYDSPPGDYQGQGTVGLVQVTTRTPPRRLLASLMAASSRFVLLPCRPGWRAAGGLDRLSRASGSCGAGDSTLLKRGAARWINRLVLREGSCGAGHAAPGRNRWPR